MLLEKQLTIFIYVGTLSSIWVTNLFQINIDHKVTSRFEFLYKKKKVLKIRAYHFFISCGFVGFNACPWLFLLSLFPMLVSFPWLFVQLVVLTWSHHCLNPTNCTLKIISGKNHKKFSPNIQQKQHATNQTRHAAYL